MLRRGHAMILESPTHNAKEAMNANQIAVTSRKPPGLARFECSSENSYGAPGDLVTGFRKKIIFFCTWATRSCLTPACQEYFVAGSESPNWPPVARKAPSFNELGR
jgi:hypothetical protein